MVSYSKEAIELAKEQGLHLVKLELNGRHAKQSTMSLACPIGPETAAKVAALFELLCKADERMK